MRIFLSSLFLLIGLSNVFGSGAEPNSYRWINLGVPLSEFRKNYWDGLSRPPDLVCTGDRTTSTVAQAATAMPHAFTRAGIRKCAFFDIRGYPTGPDLGYISTPSASLLFTHQNGRADPLLAAITAEFASSYYDRLVHLLKVRYGEPRASNEMDFVTRAGPSFRNQKLTWGTTARPLVVTRYDKSLETSKLEVLDVELMKLLIAIQTKEDEAAAARL